MSEQSIKSWVELKKMTPAFKEVLRYKHIIKKSTSSLDSLETFCKEADKVLK
ncbi:hypothetical protein [Endozoicomonas arenosclerae]|uniref:hypothetical protein n=1 Tax=Endozoicomonas arenosclerae TaxID=1633495 RepID=UPI000A7444CC|nr:hypothetical protein [Endozoicomonas arenosclerae]